MSDLYQFYNVTNSAVRKLVSGGVAYTMTLPFQPDYIRWVNYTKYGTDGSNAAAEWFRGMPAGDALVSVVMENDGGSDRQCFDLETTNGFTQSNTGPGFTDEHVTITGITTASPGVVTAASHGLSNDDRLIITKLTGDIGDELNNQRYVAKNVTTNTFELYDIFGDAVNVASTYAASGGQINKEVAEAGVENAALVYRVILGTAVMGADGDQLYVYACQVNDYEDLGDIG